MLYVKAINMIQCMFDQFDNFRELFTYRLEEPEEIFDFHFARGAAVSSDFECHFCQSRIFVVYEFISTNIQTYGIYLSESYADYVQHFSFSKLEMGFQRCL